MRTAIAVIGANYGDEGKGLVTDFISSQHAGDCTVVRFNGGAQAGHTVVTQDGRRHVFSHFGAGSFSGCPTHLSQFFVVNPRLFVKELDDLKRLCLTPRITIDARAFLTTPLDVLVNQSIEIQRGSGRHGSCGVGVNETVTRCLRNDQFLTQAQDLLNLSLLQDKLMHVSKNWLPTRLCELRVKSENPQFQKIINNMEQVIANYLEDCRCILDHADISNAVPNTKYILFEGAQGLMLDENRLDQYPHLTRSKTGLENVAFLSHRYGVEDMSALYVTRTYLTRHGAGPLPGQCDWSFSDATNVPNPYQGTLRFAPLDVENLRYSIDLDLRRGRYLFPNLTAGLAITCLDQHPMPDLSSLSLPINIASYGPARESVASYLNNALKPISRASAVLRA